MRIFSNGLGPQCLLPSSYRVLLLVRGTHTVQAERVRSESTSEIGLGAFPFRVSAIFFRQPITEFNYDDAIISPMRSCSLFWGIRIIDDSPD